MSIRSPNTVLFDLEILKLNLKVISIDMFVYNDVENLVIASFYCFGTFLSFLIKNLKIICFAVTLLKSTKVNRRFLVYLHKTRKIWENKPITF